MLTKVRYSVKDMTLWTRWETSGFIAYSFLAVFLYEELELTFLAVPWTPIALVGTAVAFILGFQNSAAYGRIWEARKVWGGIVNTSRTWGMKTKDMVTNEYATEPETEAELKEQKRILVYRHIAWLTTLRYAMRQRKKWETFDNHFTNREWSNAIHIPEKVLPIEEALFPYLSPEELRYTMDKNNKSTTLLYLQSNHLRELKEKGLIWEFSFLELENLLQEFLTFQGQSERIKNFPYPRQYATLSYIFVMIFIILLPFGIVPEFSKIATSLTDNFPRISEVFTWLAIPFCTIVSWVFHTMQRIGVVGENPFEGTANDVPISTISRGIEIDLRQLLDEEKSSIPKQFPENKNVQM
ncbi:bestrophin family ion channel [Limibacter armeniacum]|uniref:bestrophin family protein n=1 Tax=Limibacter armeniacum TaxID=466084 RepID=UPI002FE5DF32